MDEINIREATEAWPKMNLDDYVGVLIEMYADFITETGLAQMFNEYAKTYDAEAARLRVRDAGLS